MHDTKRLRRVRWAVRLTLVLGVAASVTANVLHARQNPIAQTIAAWPPLALLLTIELIARVPVHRRYLAAVRLGATAVISGIAAWVSYWHMAGVAARYGEDVIAAHLIPLSVDGLVVVASVSLVELAGRIRTAETEASATPAEAVNPAAGSVPPPAEIQEQNRTEIEPEPAAEPRRPTRAEIDAERAARRARALGALAHPDPDIDAIAADAGVTPETLQRWVDRAAQTARRPRGRRVNGAEPELAAALVTAGAPDFPAGAPATPEE